MKKTFIFASIVAGFMLAGMTTFSSCGSNPDNIEITENMSESDWDDVLDALEEVANDYVKILKKVAAGDQSVVEEGQKIEKQYQNLCNKIKDAKSDMTKEQKKRYKKIIDDLTSDASKLMMESSSSMLDN